VQTPTFDRTAKQHELRRLLSGPAMHCLAYGGSRSGKTFGFIDAICTRAVMAPGSRHGVFRFRFNAVKSSIMRDTFPKVMKLAFPGVGVSLNTQDGFALLKTKEGESEIWFGGLDDKERTEKVLGMEFATIYTNEASQIPYESYLLLQTRLAQKVNKLDGRPLALKDYVDLNPTTPSHWTNQIWIAGVEPQEQRFVNKPDYAVIHINPVDNLDNLPAEYVKGLENLPERQKKRFFLGLFQGDVEGALWRRQIIGRLSESPPLKRIVVAIDPAISTKVGSDETGIVVCGIDEQGRGIVLEDESGKYTPEEWARKAVGLYHHYQADRIIYEENQGGDMVAATIRAQAPNVPTVGVRATRGKWTRAEPIAALYERGKVFHVGVFDRLEDQMCSFTPDFDRKEQGYSPDRVDALVWGLTSLFPQIVPVAAKKPAPRPAYSANSWMG
jgi:phage terminase large subunit-like protein